MMLNLPRLLGGALLMILAVHISWAQGWRCPAQGDMWNAIDSLKQLRYPNGPYITAQGRSEQGPSEAQNTAKLELAKKISGEISFRLQKVQEGLFARQASQLQQTARFDQMALLHSDEDLVCKDAGGWVAEAHLRLQDYSDILKRAYHDSASVFRANAKQSLKAKDVKAFTTSWQRAKRLQPSVVSRGLYLVALLADASRGMSVDISAALDKTSFPLFFEDMALWDQVVSNREQRLLSVSVGIMAGTGARTFSVDVANLLSEKGIVLANSGASYNLVLQGTESGFESSYGSIWTCRVQGSAELIGPRKIILGKRILRDDSWKEYASGDSTEACNKAWRKMGESEELGLLLLPLFGSVAPLD